MGKGGISPLEKQGFSTAECFMGKGGISPLEKRGFSTASFAGG
jgi:hypothetical protein